MITEGPPSGSRRRSAGGSGAHWMCSTSVRRRRSRARPTRCSAARTGSRSLERPKSLRADGVEELTAPVPLGVGRLAEAKPRRHELDVEPAAGKRRRERVVVRDRERSRVDERDAHRPTVIARMSLLVRTWNVFHGRTSPPSSALHLEEMVRTVVEDGPDVVAFQEVPVWALDRLEAWSGMTRRPRRRDVAARGSARTEADRAEPTTLAIAPHRPGERPAPLPPARTGRQAANHPLEPGVLQIGRGRAPVGSRSARASTGPGTAVSARLSTCGS